MKENRKEGFWRQSETSTENLPQWIPRALFLEMLAEKQKSAKTICYKGWSICRICGQLNGTKSYVLDGWEWPEGFEHYVRDHDVKPSDDFIAFVFSSLVGAEDCEEDDEDDLDDEEVDRINRLFERSMRMMDGEEDDYERIAATISGKLELMGVDPDSICIKDILWNDCRVDDGANHVQLTMTILYEREGNDELF